MRHLRIALPVPMKFLLRRECEARSACVAKTGWRTGTVFGPAGSFHGRDEQGDDDMFSRIITAAALATVLATTAYAANTSSNSAPNPNTMSKGQQTANNQQNLPQEIRTKLKDDGFSDVKVVPGSFIVSAKDKRGEPVTMVISPNSTMMVTQITSRTGSSPDGQK
ncbi:MAG: hypothetical protein KGK33_11725 [Hyphomicrobiales bacterium]|nr:hypothetical protein [Hyphomicrobiales bacterium]